METGQGTFRRKGVVACQGDGRGPAEGQEKMTRRVGNGLHSPPFALPCGMLGSPPASPHVCARCRACCVLPAGGEGDVSAIMPLFPEEVDRLRALLPDDDARGPAVIREVTSEALQAAMLSLFPDYFADIVRERLPAPGEHWRLRTDDTGRCVFLDEHGCRLTQAERPAHCLLFPLWVRAGRLTALDAPCLAVKETGGVVWRLLEALDMTAPQVRDAWTRLCRAWDMPSR